MIRPGIPVESDVTFGFEDTVRWRRFFGANNHPSIPQDLYGVEIDGNGRLRLTDRTIIVPVALYVAVDHWGGILYIGQVCRTSGTGLVQRIDGHNAIPQHCAGIWLLPLRDDCPSEAVSQLERALIEAYQPLANRQHSPRGREYADSVRRVEAAS